MGRIDEISNNHDDRPAGRVSGKPPMLSHRPLGNAQRVSIQVGGATRHRFARRGHLLTIRELVNYEVVPFRSASR